MNVNPPNCLKEGSFDAFMQRRKNDKPAVFRLYLFYLKKNQRSVAGLCFRMLLAASATDEKGIDFSM
jgi:hypothetical protein